MNDKKDPTILKDSFSLSFLLFSSAVTRAFSSPIKGKAGRPIEDGSDPTLNRSDLDTHKRSNRALSTLSLFSLETWDLSLSPVCNPYYKLSVLVT